MYGQEYVTLYTCTSILALILLKYEWYKCQSVHCTFMMKKNICLSNNNIYSAQHYILNQEYVDNVYLVSIEASHPWSCKYNILFIADTVLAITRVCPKQGGIIKIFHFSTELANGWLALCQTPQSGTYIWTTWKLSIEWKTLESDRSNRITALCWILCKKYARLFIILLWNANIFVVSH
jgi:hypothetical protein